MELLKLLKKENCAVHIKSKKKEDAIEELAQLLKKSETIEILSEQEIASSLLAREELGSTGFGDGIAIPHCKFNHVEKFAIGMATSRKGVDFNSIDGKKVQLFFVVVGPEDQPETHLKILAQISRIIKDKKVRQELIDSPTQTALYERFLRHIRVESNKQKKDVKKKLLICVVNQEEFVEDILEFFIEIGIRGATVLESVGMGKKLSTVPLFADFINFLGADEDFSRTIMTTIYEDEVDDIISGIENITGDLDKYRGVMVLVLDLFRIKGTMEM